MSAVAKACGYSAPTSTGYYRRMAASRLFKMVQPQSARLTQLALDYLRPDSDDAKTRALKEAVRSVPTYQTLLEKYSGTKLNARPLANGIMRVSDLTDDCALICAKVFIESLRFAGNWTRTTLFWLRERTVTLARLPLRPSLATRQYVQFQSVQKETWKLTL